MNEKTIKKAEEILCGRGIRERGACVLALIDADGFPTAATISPSRIDGIRAVAFCTGLGSNWAKRIEGCDRASVCFNSEAEQYNITLVGTIETVTDPETKREMWYDGLSHYFSGPEDPAYCVLSFHTKRYSLMLNEPDGVLRGTL